MFDSVIVPQDWVERRAAPRSRCRARRSALRLRATTSVLPVLVAAVRHRRCRRDPGAAGHDRQVPRRACAGARSRPRRSASAASRSQIVAFALSAGIAGLGGGLLAMPGHAGELRRQLRSPSSGSSGSCSSSRSVRGPSRARSQAGLAFAFVPEILKDARRLARRTSSSCSGSARSPTPSTPRASSSPRSDKSLQRMQKFLQRRSGSDDPDDAAPDGCGSNAARPRDGRREP